MVLSLSPLKVSLGHLVIKYRTCSFDIPCMGDPCCLGSFTLWIRFGKSGSISAQYQFRKSLTVP